MGIVKTPKTAKTAAAWKPEIVAKALTAGRKGLSRAAILRPKKQVEAISAALGELLRERTVVEVPHKMSKIYFHRAIVEEYSAEILTIGEQAGERGVLPGAFSRTSSPLLGHLLAELEPRGSLVRVGLVPRGKRDLPLYLHRTVFDAIARRLPPLVLDEGLLRRWFKEGLSHSGGLPNVTLTWTLQRYREWAAEHGVEARVEVLHDILKQLSREGKVSLGTTMKSLSDRTKAEREAGFKMNEVDFAYYWSFVG